MHDVELVGTQQQVVERDLAGHWLLTLAKAFALFGGAMFIALVVMSVVSIVSRKLGFAPITGDLELMQVGTAIGAAAFLPYCTMMGDHLKVEFFTEAARPVFRHSLDCIGSLLIALVFAVIVWRTALQVLDTREANEVTTLLAIPLWIPKAGLLPSLLLTVLCSVQLAWNHHVERRNATVAK